MSHSKIIKYLQRFFRVLERAAPFLSRKLALRLFVTPFKFPRSTWEKELLASARVTRREWRQVEYQQKKGAYYYTYQWGQEGPPVLLIHGWGGRGSQMGYLGKALAGAGFRAIAFDAPGHGESSGRTTNILEITRMILELHQIYGDFAAIIGHSFGGVAGAFALRKGCRAERLITIGSPATLDYVVDNFGEQLQVGNKTVEYLKAYVEERSGLPRKHFSLAWLASELALPGLIIHDRDDQEVKVSQAYQLHESWPQAELLLTDGLGHYRVLRDNGVKQAVLERLTPKHALHNAAL